MLKKLLIKGVNEITNVRFLCGVLAGGWTIAIMMAHAVGIL